MNERGANNPMEPSPPTTLRNVRDSVSREGETMQPATRSNGAQTHEESEQVASFRNHGRVSPEIEVRDRPKKKGRKRKKRDESRQVEGGDRSCVAGDIMGTQHEKVDEVGVHEGRLDFFRNNGQVSPEIDEVLDQPKKKGRKRRKRDECWQTDEEDKAGAVGDHNGTSKTVGTRHGVKEVDVHGDLVHSEVEPEDQDNHEDLLRMFRNTEAQGEHIRIQLQDFDNEQLEESTMWDAADELMEHQGIVETHVVREGNADAELVEGDTLVNEPIDQAQRPNDRPNNQTRGDSRVRFQHAQEVTEEVADLGTSSLITFNIKHQAAVNHLYDMGSIGISQRLSDSLDTMRSSGHDAPHSIRFTNIVLSDDGDVEVHTHADSKGDMQRLSRIRGWDLEFEKSISVPTESFAVETSSTNLASFNIQTRKCKAAAIKKLLENHLRYVGSLRSVSLRSVDDIRDIHWCNTDKRDNSLIIEARTAQQANEILDSGVFVHGKHYKCQSVDQALRQCGRCQAFDHDELSCSFAPRCGNCASQHVTSACISKIRDCANCHGSHQANAAWCPARKAHRLKFRYVDRSSQVEETDRKEPAIDRQSRTAARNAQSSNTMPITPHIEPEIKLEEDQSLPNPGPVREFHQGAAAAQRHTFMVANAPHETYVKAEDIEPVQEMGVVQNDPLDLTLILRRLDELRMAFEQNSDPDLTLILRKFETLRVAIEKNAPPNRTLLQRQLEDLRLLVEPLSVPQHHRSPRRKRRGDEILTGEPSSYARKRPKRTTRGRYRGKVPKSQP